jgi:two-component sensor histidine kinase/PAS domain-containing protein
MTVPAAMNSGQGTAMLTLAADALRELTQVVLSNAGRGEVAACAAHWLRRMIPGGRAIVLEATDGSPVAMVLADTDVSGVQEGNSIAVVPNLVIDQAIRAPFEVFRGSAIPLLRSLPDLDIDPAHKALLITARPIDDGPAQVVLVGLADHDSLAAPAEAAVRILVDYLATAFTATESRAAITGAHQMIIRAKLEWEATVDALGDLVCLLDPEGRIVRANRVAEFWGLGKVSSVVGQTPHALFHPGCSSQSCSLEKALSSAWRALPKDGHARFEHYPEASRKVLHFTFRPVQTGATITRSNGETLVVLVVSNTSDLHEAREAINKLNASLETRIRHRTQELREAIRGLRNEIARRKSAEEALQTSHAELGALSQQLIVAQETERHRIARELHDSVGQSLSAIKYSLERASELLRRSDLGDPEQVLDQAIRATQETSAAIATIATSLRPTVLDDMGAASALAGFCQQFATVYPSLVVDTRVLVTDDEIPERLATAVFRSAQELLNNVAKHARATQVIVELRSDPDRLILVVADDGIGIAKKPASQSRTGGHGIRNLRERAEMTGGIFTLIPGRNKGTIASISWHLLSDEIARQEAL